MGWIHLDCMNKWSFIDFWEALFIYISCESRPVLLLSGDFTAPFSPWGDTESAETIRTAAKCFAFGCKQVCSGEAFLLA